MHPILFRIAGLFIPSYMVAQLVAIGIGAGWLQLRRDELELPESVGLDMMLLGLGAVYLGGRLESLRRGTSLLEGGVSIFMSSGGVAFFGVLFVAMAGAALYARFHGRRVLFVWDAMAPVIPLALIPYRMGCFLAGCCYGTPTSLPWGVHYPEGWPFFDTAIALHPAPIYEMALALACFAFLRWLQHKPDRGVGDVTLAFVLVMAPMRFFTDLFRGDAVLRMSSWSESILLTQAQWWCVLGALGAVSVLFWRKLRAWPNGAQRSEETKART